MYNLAISFHKHLYEDMFTNAYFLTYWRAFLHSCTRAVAFSGDFTGWLQIHRDCAYATAPEQKEAGLGWSYQVFYKIMLIFFLFLEYRTKFSWSLNTVFITNNLYCHSGGSCFLKASLQSMQPCRSMCGHVTTHTCSKHALCSQELSGPTGIAGRKVSKSLTHRGQWWTPSWAPHLKKQKHLRRTSFKTKGISSCAMKPALGWQPSHSLLP